MAARPTASRCSPTSTPDRALVSFSSAATNLTGEPNQNGARDIYVHHVTSGRILRASTTTTGEDGNGECINAVPGDDWHVVMHCAASNLVPGNTNGIPDIFVKDLVTGLVTRVNVRPGGVQSQVEPSFAAMSISLAARASRLPPPMPG